MKKDSRLKNTAIGSVAGMVAGAALTPGNKTKPVQGAVYANPKDKPGNIPGRVIGGGLGAIVGGVMGYKATKKKK